MATSPSIVDTTLIGESSQPSNESGSASPNHLTAASPGDTMQGSVNADSINQADDAPDTSPAVSSCTATRIPPNSCTAPNQPMRIIDWLYEPQFYQVIFWPGKCVKNVVQIIAYPSPTDEIIYFNVSYHGVCLNFSGVLPAYVDWPFCNCIPNVHAAVP